MQKQKKKLYSKIICMISLCALLLWTILGTGASLAWFSDTSDRLDNIFHFADFDIEFAHRLDNGDWDEIESQESVFDNSALYEPGYTQVVYLRVKNNGTAAFDFYTAVSVNNYTTATNVFGQTFNLQDYLKFGVYIADTEAEMDEAVKTRTLARSVATMPLGDYETNVARLNSGETSYIALVVWMPEEVRNEANYRGTQIPYVDLGIIAKADQIRN